MIRNETNRHSHIRCLWKAIEYLENRRIETYALKRNKLSYNTRVNSLNFLYYFYVNLTTIQKGETRWKKTHTTAKIFSVEKLILLQGEKLIFFSNLTYNTIAATMHFLPPFCLQFLQNSLFLQTQNSSWNCSSIWRIWKKKFFLD